jgi:hypothetical protein
MRLMARCVDASEGLLSAVSHYNFHSDFPAATMRDDGFDWREGPEIAVCRTLDTGHAKKNISRRVMGSSSRWRVYK